MTRLVRRAVFRTVRALALVVFAVAATAGVVAAAWAGVVLAGERPVPDSQARLRPVHGARARDWTELASAACVRGRHETMAAIDGASSFRGSRKALTLRLLRDDLRIEGRLLARLSRLHPGRADRGPYREALRLFRGAHAADRRLVALLAQGPSDLGVALPSRRDDRLNGRIRLRFYQVGAFGCATYFDPASW